MASFYNLLKYAATGIASADMTAFDKQRALAAFGWKKPAMDDYDKIAKIAGAGTLVPITGFANAVSSPAIDARAEGFVLGVGAKIFTVAGPVILYGTVAGTIYGIIYWIISML